MTAADRPRIGVSWLAASEAATHACVRAVRDAGGEPVPLLIEDESWTALLPGLDGLVLTGVNARLQGYAPNSNVVDGSWNSNEWWMQ